MDIKRFNLGLLIAGLSISLVLTIATGMSVAALGRNTLSQTVGKLSGGNEITISSTTSMFRRQQTQLNTKVKLTVTNGYNEYLLTTDGRLFSWGRGAQAGNWSEHDQPLPVDLTDRFNGETVSDIAVSGTQTLFATSSGLVYGVGLDSHNIMGGQAGKFLSPRRLSASLFDDALISQIAAGPNNAVFLSKDGRVFYSGEAVNAPFNDGDDMGHGKGIYAGGDLTPTDMTSQFDGTVTVIAPNYAVTDKGKVYTWGRDSGTDGVTTAGRPVDITNQLKLKPGEAVTAIRQSTLRASESGKTTAIMTSSGRILTMGDNSRNGIGNGQSDTKRYDFTDITGQFKDDRVIQLISPTAALTESGRLYMWGTMLQGSSGQGGTGKSFYPSWNKPSLMSEQIETSTKYLNSNENNSGLLRIFTDGVVAFAGMSRNGQAGNGTYNYFRQDAIDITSNFGSITSKHNIDMVKSVKFGDKDAKFATVDNKTMKVVVPAATEAGRVNVTVTDVYDNKSTEYNAYEYSVDGKPTINDDNDTAPVDATGIINSQYVPAGYQYKWGDEFNGNKLDPNKWSGRYRLGGSHDACIDNGPDRRYVGGGSLHLVVNKNGDRICQAGDISQVIGYTKTASGAPAFKITGAIKYGYIETRMKARYNSGAYPAFWKMSQTALPDRGTAQGYTETDIIEGKGAIGGGKGRQIASEIKYSNSSSVLSMGRYIFGLSPQPRIESTVGADGDEWVTYSLLWTPDTMETYVNGKLTTRMSLDDDQAIDHEVTVGPLSRYYGNSYFHDPSFLILGGGATDTDIDESKLPFDQQFDYVRVYQLPGTGEIYQQPRFVGDSLKTGELGRSYRDFLPSISQPVKDNHYEITAGALPDGLSMNDKTGKISGTPTQLGDYKFTVKVTNRQFAGESDTREIAVKIDKAKSADSGNSTDSFIPGVPNTAYAAVGGGLLVITAGAAGVAYWTRRASKCNCDHQK